MDLERLRALVAEVGGTRLVIIDPVSAYLGTMDAWRNTLESACLENLRSPGVGVP